MVRVLILVLALFAIPISERCADAQSQKESAKPATDSTQSTSGEEEFACTMHPEIRTKERGKCPKCGMVLVSTTPGVVDDFHLKMTATPAAPKPGEKVRFAFHIFNPKTGATVKDFALLHDRLFHLFIISQDLTQFQHIHPAFSEDGSFTIETMLPQPGHYKIYCDFYPMDGAPQVLQQNITTAGYKNDLFAATPRLKADESLTKICETTKITKENAGNLGVELALVKPAPMNNLKIELHLEPQEIIAGKPTALRYHLTDARTGEPIKDLSPYLGAFGHTLILSEDQTDYVHSHPNEVPPDLFDMDVQDEKAFLGGPDVTFEAMFPRPGNYRIWTQFLRGDQMTTVTFNVRAERLK